MAGQTNTLSNLGLKDTRMPRPHHLTIILAGKML